MKCTLNIDVIVYTAHLLRSPTKIITFAFRIECLRIMMMMMIVTNEDDGNDCFYLLCLYGNETHIGM